MSALFPKYANTVFRVVLVVLLGTPAVAIGGLMLFARTPYGTGTQAPISQPVQFDHRHHSIDVGIDCRFCHATVEDSPSAGIPSTQVCMGCHVQVWNKSPLLEPVRQAYFNDQPIPWERVHNLPDFVYFNHAIHVNKGVGCVSCHGRVDQMASVYQAEDLTMGWCIECHRDPAPKLRPRDQITSMTWTPGGDPIALGKQLVEEYDVHTRTACTTCHR
jgi:hypothetical protein